MAIGCGFKHRTRRARLRALASSNGSSVTTGVSYACWAGQSPATARVLPGRRTIEHHQMRKTSRRGFVASTGLLLLLSLCACWKSDRSSPEDIRAPWMGVHKRWAQDPSSAAAETTVGFVLSADGTGYTLSPNFAFEQRFDWSIANNTLELTWIDSTGAKKMGKGAYKMSYHGAILVLVLDPGVHPNGTTVFRRT